MNAAQRRKGWRRAKRLKGKTVNVRLVRWWGNNYGARWMRGIVVWAGRVGGRIELDVALDSRPAVVVIPAGLARGNVLRADLS